MPYSGGRPKLIGLDDKSFLLIYSSGDQLRIIKGIPNANQTSWQWTKVRMPVAQSCFGEALYDLERWQSGKILSIYSQEKPSNVKNTQLKNALDGGPSALKVVDFRVKNR